MENRLRTIILIQVLLLFSLKGIGQQKTLMVYDLSNNSLDSIAIAFDTTITKDQTNHFIGNYDLQFEQLEETSPTTNVYPNSQFTKKQRVSDDYQITNYPIRTSIKVFTVENDTLRNNCSGSMISRKHVLTAAHCVLEINSNDIKLDSLYVCPIYDNGAFSSAFDCSYVDKIYYFKDWSVTREDIAILELKEALGEETGWLSIGFNEDNSFFEDKIHYKFSYPSVSIPFIDTTEYNGDTLYYNYGQIDITSPHHLGINNSSGIIGESGSSIVMVQNEETYRSYGVLSYSNGLLHSRIKDWIYYAIESVIADDLVKTNSVETQEAIEIYPNPSNEIFYLKGINNKTIEELIIYDNLGRPIKLINSIKEGMPINLSNIPNGIYHINMRVNNQIVVRKIIKWGN